MLAAPPAAPAHSWSQVERSASYFVLVVLGSVIATRLAFAEVWQLPPLDLALSCVALVLVLAAFWLARRRRAWRIAVITFASATQLVPMVIRHPVILLPLVGALIPVAILLGCLVALSRKNSTSGR